METAMSRPAISGAPLSEFTGSTLLALFETSANDTKRANTRETSPWAQFITEVLRRRAVREESQRAEFLSETLRRSAASKESRWAQFRVITEVLHRRASETSVWEHLISEVFSRDESGGTPFSTIGSDESDGLAIFNCIQALYLSHNQPRDRQIAERITNLHRIVLGEGEQISAGSLEQFTEFFRKEPELAFPRITMTPDGTLRARWIQDREHFVAIEFTGKPLVRLVAEVPRDGGQTASYFASEPFEGVVVASRKLGARFG